MTDSDTIHASAAAGAHDSFDVRLVAIRYAARDVNVYEFERIDGDSLPPIEPGAHIDLHLANGMTRQYSMTAAGADPQSYAVAIKRDPQSRGGSRFVHHDLRVGAVLKMSGPRNNFRLLENADHTVLFAGGIGVTPIWCMVQRLDALRRSWELHYACRSREDAAFASALRAFRQVNFHFDDERGGKFLDVAGIVANAPKRAHLYCCGPAPMLAAFEAATAAWPAEQVHIEYFTPKAAPSLDGGFVVELARSGREFVIPPGETILDVLLDAGLDVPFSCEQGICGSCETRVISGVPEHRDSVLTPGEQAANRTVMICCAGSKSDRLVLDL